MARKRWLFKPVDKHLAKELALQCDIDPMVALLLAGRGYSDPFEIDAFLNLDEPLSDPFELPDMEKAVSRIRTAMENNEKIAICGDYDADGVTASALLYLYLTQRNCDVTVHIPHRLDEGYGLHTAAIDGLYHQGVTLIITVDNGISAVEEVEYASTLGIDVVVTDHHQPGEILPGAVAVVDPHLPNGENTFSDYAGVGVAFLLACGIEGCSCEELLDEYGDLVAIGTVADVVPMRGENRILVHGGLEVLNRMDRIGLQELVSAADLPRGDLSVDHIGYGIAPRLNAAGRMGDSMRSFRLLITHDIHEARLLAGEVCHENLRRKDVESGIWEASRLMHLESGIHFYDRVIVVTGEGWHLGVLGIVASRLVNQFGKPAIVLSIDGEVARGSARSVDGFDLFQSLCACSDCLIQFGGHPLAAGLTIATEKIGSFVEQINQYAKSQGPRPLPSINIDCKLSPLGATEHTAAAIRSLSPFGVENPVPNFALMNMELRAITPVGGGKSIRLTLCRDQHTVVCMKFNTSLQDFPYRIGDRLDLTVVFRYGMYKGRPAFSLVVQEVRPADFDDDSFFRDMLLYESFKAGEDLSREDKQLLLPSREEMASLFRCLRTLTYPWVSPEWLVYYLKSQISYGKILIALDVFDEFGFIQKQFDGERLYINFLNPTGKFDLSTSNILFQLQS